jgi:hypothetical protein
MMRVCRPAWDASAKGRWRSVIAIHATMAEPTGRDLSRPQNLRPRGCGAASRSGPERRGSNRDLRCGRPVMVVDDDNRENRMI